MYEDLSKQALKGTNTELMEFSKSAPETFAERFAPLSVDDELGPSLSAEKLEYLQYLLSAHDHVFIDTTRLGFHVESLLDGLPQDTLLIHLYRDVRGFVSSHLIPNRPELKKKSRLAYLRSRARRRWNRDRFWKVTSGFNDWGYEHLARRLSDDPDEPAYRALMRLWQASYTTIQRTIDRWENSLSISFESFTENPLGEVKRVYDRCGMTVPTMDLSRIRAASRGYHPEAPEWIRAAKELGIELPDSK